MSLLQKLRDAARDKLSLTIGAEAACDLVALIDAVEESCLEEAKRCISVMRFDRSVPSLVRSPR